MVSAAGMLLLGCSNCLAARPKHPPSHTPTYPTAPPPKPPPPPTVYGYMPPSVARDFSIVLMVIHQVIVFGLFAFPMSVRRPHMPCTTLPAAALTL